MRVQVLHTSCLVFKPVCIRDYRVYILFKACLNVVITRLQGSYGRLWGSCTERLAHQARITIS